MCKNRFNRTDEWRPFLTRNAKERDGEDNGGRRGRGDKTRDKSRRVNVSRRQRERKRDERCFSNPGATRARPSRLMKRAYLPAECASQKTKGTAIVLSAAAAKSARGSLHDRTLPSATQPLHPPIDSAFLSRVLFDFRRVILLLVAPVRACPDF